MKNITRSWAIPQQMGFVNHETRRLARSALKNAESKNFALWIRTKNTDYPHSLALRASAGCSFERNGIRQIWSFSDSKTHQQDLSHSWTSRSGWFETEIRIYLSAVSRVYVLIVLEPILALQLQLPHFSTTQSHQQKKTFYYVWKLCENKLASVNEWMHGCMNEWKSWLTPPPTEACYY